MPRGKVVAIYICPTAGAPMQPVTEVEAIAGVGLKGDRYCTGKGSWNKGEVGKRQVTLMNARFFDRSGFYPADSRRNIFTDDVELMALIGTEFWIGSTVLRGVEYCAPCDRPDNLSGSIGFRQAFQDCGGLVAEVIVSGIIRRGCGICLADKQHEREKP